MENVSKLLKEEIANKVAKNNLMRGAKALFGPI